VPEAEKVALVAAAEALPKVTEPGPLRRDQRVEVAAVAEPEREVATPTVAEGGEPGSTEGAVA
jgi:hypothetical protein